MDTFYKAVDSRSVGRNLKVELFQKERRFHQEKGTFPQTWQLIRQTCQIPSMDMTLSSQLPKLASMPP